MTELAQTLMQTLGEDRVSQDFAQRRLLSQDIFYRDVVADLVVRPQSTPELCKAVASATAAGYAVHCRGGGMSYTAAYTPLQNRAVVMDMSGLDKVLEINVEDMYVTVEAGCTWQTLHAALQPTGLRTPFWGPLSGIHATVGGSASNNAVYWGAAAHGSAADSIIGLQVVLADGQVVHTGAAAHGRSEPFFRHYGPDLTGLFSCDCGALGVKATVSLRLLPQLPAVRHCSFDFATQAQQIAAMSEVARNNLVAQMFGTDPGLGQIRAQRERLLNDAKALAGVMAASPSLLQAARDGARLALSGRRILANAQFPLHANIEANCDAAAEHALARLTEICQRHGGTAMAASVPMVLHANPFSPLNNMVGPQGERWVPVHGLLPHSKVLAATEACQALFAHRREQLDSHGIVTGFLLTTVATNCFFVEPLFFWPDELQELHTATVQPEVLRRQKGFAANLAARELVTELRAQLIELFDQFGASHLQVGKSYRYRQGLRPVNFALLQQIKHAVDPKGLINPGCLGLN